MVKFKGLHCEKGFVTLPKSLTRILLLQQIFLLFKLDDSKIFFEQKKLCYGSIEFIVTAKASLATKSFVGITNPFS